MLEESMSTVPNSSIWASIFSWFTPTVFFVFLNLTIGTIYFTSSLASSSNKPGGGGAGVGEGEDDEINPKLVRSPSILQRLKSINLYSYRSPQPVPAATTTVYEKVPDMDVGGFHFSFQHQTTPLQDQREQQQAYLDRSPSVLQRLKSINLYSYFSPEQHKTQEIYSHYSASEQAQEEEEDEQVREVPEKEEENQGQRQTLDEIYSQLKDGHVARTKSDSKPASGEVPTKLPRKMRKSASVKPAFSHFEEEDIVEARRPATVREGKAKATVDDDDDDDDDDGDGVDAKADDFINKFKQQLKLQRVDSILRYKEMVNRGSGR